MLSFQLSTAVAITLLTECANVFFPIASLAPKEQYAQLKPHIISVCNE